MRVALKVLHLKLRQGRIIFGEQRRSAGIPGVEKCGMEDLMGPAFVGRE